MRVRAVAHVTLLLAGLTPSAVGQWAPRTIPFLEGSYSPDRGFVGGGGVVHTRYSFRALPPSTELLLAAAYATETTTLQARLQGDFRALFSPTVLHIGLLASGFEIIRFYGAGNETDGSRPDSVCDVRQAQFSFTPSLVIRLAPGAAHISKSRASGTRRAGTWRRPSAFSRWWRRRRDHTLSLAVAQSLERTAVYARAGFMF